MHKSTTILDLIMTNDEEFFIELGERIRDLRKERHMTQGELAKQLGVTQALIASYELATRNIPIRKLISIAEILGVSFEEIIGHTKHRRLKRGPASKIEQRLLKIEQLPKSEQKFLIKMLDNALADVH